MEPFIQSFLDYHISMYLLKILAIRGDPPFEFQLDNASLNNSREKNVVENENKFWRDTGEFWQLVDFRWIQACSTLLETELTTLAEW